MAFPEDPLDSLFEMRINGVWTNITADVYRRAPLNHKRGRPPKGTRTDPGSVDLLLDNRTKKYSPRYPMGEYFNGIGRNTELRYSVPGAESYLELDGTATGLASTPDVAALDIVGDIDVRAEITTDWQDIGKPTSKNYGVIGKWSSTLGNRSWMLRVIDRLIIFVWSTDGTNQNQATFNVPSQVRPRIAIRATLDVNDGAGGHIAQLYWAESLDDPNWVALGGPFNGVGVTSVFSGTAPLSVGVFDSTTTPNRIPFIGRGHRFEVRTGIGGTVVANPDFRSQAVGAPSFADGTGKTWTLAGTSRVTDRQYRFVTEMAEWPLRWVKSEQDVYIPAKAAGVLRRMGQGKKALESTLRRRLNQTSAPDMLATWPMEEGISATEFSSPIAGVQTAKFTGMELAAVDTMPGAKALPKLRNPATLRAAIPASTSASQGWQVEFVFFLPTMPAAQSQFFRVECTNSTMRFATVYCATAGITVEVRNIENVVLATVTFFSAQSNADFVGRWNRMRMYVEDAGGGQTHFRAAWLDITTSVGWVATATFTGTRGIAAKATGTWGAGTLDMAMGHLSAFDGDTIPNQVYNGSDEAFDGEAAVSRMDRITNEENTVPFRWTDGDLSLGSELVGPQRQATLLDILESAAAADGGLLYEDRDRIGLVYRDRYTMQNQDPKLTLAYSSVAAPSLAPTDDDLDSVNDVVVTRDGGSFGQATLRVGRMSIQDPPSGIGLYDTQVTLSLATDAQASVIAGWLLHLGTWDEPRVESLSVRLHKHPELIPYILELDVGDRIQVTGVPTWVSASGVLDLLLDGYDEQFGPHTWDIQFNCSPAGPWDVGVVENSIHDRVDTDGTTLQLAADSTQTTLQVHTTQTESAVETSATWTEDAFDTPFDINVGGEVMRVTAVGTQLTPNPFFDADTTGWVAAGGATTIQRSTDFVPVEPRAVATLKVTPPGGVASGGVDQTPRSPVGSVVPGTTYQASGWVYVPAGWTDLRTCIDWYTSGDVFISTSLGSGTSVVAGTWTFLTQSLVAPATASRAIVRARYGGTPAASVVWYVWGLRLTAAPALGYDTFTRTTASTWGTSTDNHAWQEDGGVVTDRSTNGTQGVVTLAANPSTIRHQTILESVTNCDILASIGVSATATGAAFLPAVLVRWTGTSNFYRIRLEFNTTGTLFVALTRGVTAVGSSVNTGLTYVGGDMFRLRVRLIGHRVLVRVWRVGDEEPKVWLLDLTVTSAEGTIDSGRVGVSASAFAGNTNVNPQLRFDDFQVINPQKFTVERSLNNIVKAQTAGTDVRLNKPTVTSG